MLSSLRHYGAGINGMNFGILQFSEQYAPRLWGGSRLAALGKMLPADQCIGEAWLIADHPQCESRVISGERKGDTLRTLMEEWGDRLLGTAAHPAANHRFPLLLKLIDAGDMLSVQVHPDDAAAKALHEPDGGKTEMWHILNAAPDSRIISGTRHGVTADSFRTSLPEGGCGKLLREFPVSPGDSIFVPAGAVHAIGAGILLAEIQQNSDITYRLYDWGRVDVRGIPRELHVDKGLQVARFGEDTGGRMAPLRCTGETCVSEYLCASRFFAAQRITLYHKTRFTMTGSSFRIILALQQQLVLEDQFGTASLQPGEAALVPAWLPWWEASGTGSFLCFYVPDATADIIEPLRRHGYSNRQILSLGEGDPGRMLQSLLQ